MSNELLWLIFAIVNFILLIGMYKLFGKLGIFVWIAMATIIANIQVTKNISLFGLTATLGNVMYGTIFLGTDALNEIFSKKDAKKAVYLGFYVMISTLILMQLALVFIPNESDISQSSLQTIFGFFPRIVVGSLFAFICSQLLDVSLFQWIRKLLPENKWLWVRNNGSTIVSQFFDTLIFVPIAFWGVYDFETLKWIFVTTYLIKVLVAALDTPFLYFMKKIKPLDILQDKR
ncbi:MAG: queuosine precursor transporter [Candidatus Izemoplasmatales bacterium]|jgi:hypothetical protein|nr:queuosine precursor transporter [Candidatus Izemoplasmatales bacterium]